MAEPGSMAQLLDDCVHCGFCLPTCPTYVLWGEEMDSPRGRIQLMQQAVEGEVITDAMVGHWDACLGCMACVTACPSGVQYDRLIEETRAEVERVHTRSAGDRALRRTGLLDRMAPSLAAMERLAPRLSKPERLAERLPARGTRRMVVGMLTGCVQGAFFPGVNAATARVLQAEGCEVVVPPTQGCCGALSVHNGRAEEAKRYARRLIGVFERTGVERIVVNAAGCGSSMKEYAALLADDPTYAAPAKAFQDKVRDVSEVLDELGPVAQRHPLEVTVAYHDACHLGHAQGVRVPPRRLLEGVPGLELREIAEAELCCGSAGVYNVLNPEPARELGDRKARNIVATGAEVLVTANPGCLMQVAAAIEDSGHPMRLAHTVEVLDASIRGRPL
jgi:glycolate dehydrogenase iron-sulfur subunit